MERDIDQIENTVFSGAVAPTERIYSLRREATDFYRAVHPLLAVVSILERQADPYLAPYLRDVHDHVLRINDSIDNMRDMLGTALSVNLSLVTLAQGETVKRLGAWAALLAAPTLVTSWYGMNFEHMPELAPPWAYPVLIVGVAVICVGLYTLFKRARWL